MERIVYHYYLLIPFRWCEKCENQEGNEKKIQKKQHSLESYQTIALGYKSVNIYETISIQPNETKRSVPVSRHTFLELSQDTRSAVIASLSLSEAAWIHGQHTAASERKQLCRNCAG